LIKAVGFANYESNVNKSWEIHIMGDLYLWFTLRGSW